MTVTRDLLGLAASFAFVFAFIGAATALLKRGVLAPWATRKVVHIGVSHWWLLYIAFVESPWVGAAGTGSFILINALSVKLRLFKAMEDPERSGDLGTVWFPISLLALVGLSAAGILERWEAGVGVMAMGWGDGMAALAGRRFGARSVEVFGRRKSLPGTAALVLFSAAAAAALTAAFEPGIGTGDLLSRALATGLFAALVEFCTPFGLDNLTVPLLTALFYRYGASGPAALPFALAVAANVLVAWAAFRKQAVDASGAAAGAAVGSAIMAAGGWQAYSLLAAFFLSSTTIGRAAGRKRAPSGIEEKGGRRDAIQVLANCGASAAAVLAHAATGNPAWLAAFAAGFASANADTWASEIGVLHRKLPRSILTFKPVPAGASGGVSSLGFLAAALGAVFIALVFSLAFGSSTAEAARIGAVAAAAGFLGALLDSVMGATLQAQYSCAKTGRYTERPRTGEAPNILVRGVRWFNNDAVNLASTAAATAAAAFAFMSLG